MEDKKLHIIKNVGIMYMKYGIRAVTMDDVANEFGISKKTLYQYFSDKQELVSSVIDYYIENPEVDFNDYNHLNAIETIFTVRAHVARLLKFYNNSIEYDLKKLYPALYKKVYNEKRKHVFQNTISNISKGKEEGLYRNEIDPELIAKLQVGRIFYTLNPDYDIFKEDEVNSLQLFDDIMDYHMHAICTTKGIKIYTQQLNKVQNENKN
jgi:AcrR family transcriptional regulator